MGRLRWEKLVQERHRAAPISTATLLEDGEWRRKVSALTPEDLKLKVLRYNFKVRVPLLNGATNFMTCLQKIRRIFDIIL